MPITNRMTELINKVEANLGTDELNLPEKLQKQHWADKSTLNKAGGPIALFTIPVFSRMYPVKTTVYLDNAKRDRDGWYILDEIVGLESGITILGAGDIEWTEYGGGISSSISAGYGIYMPNNAIYGLPDIMMSQMSADISSAFSNANNIYVDFKEPNKVKLRGPNGINYNVDMVRNYPLVVFIEHNHNLMTIAPTKMTLFEELATADVAKWLYKRLLRYDNLESVFGNTDLKLGDLENEASRRDQVLEELKEGQVSAANDAMPMVMLI